MYTLKITHASRFFNIIVVYYILPSFPLKASRKLITFTVIHIKLIWGAYIMLWQAMPSYSVKCNILAVDCRYISLNHIASSQLTMQFIKILMIDISLRDIVDIVHLHFWF